MDWLRLVSILGGLAVAMGGGAGLAQLLQAYTASKQAPAKIAMEAQAASDARDRADAEITEGATRLAEMMLNRASKELGRARDDLNTVRSELDDARKDIVELRALLIATWRHIDDPANPLPARPYWAR